MANVARVSREANEVLDMYAGSGATLMAASDLIGAGAVAVGVERGSERLVGFEEILEDFERRGLGRPGLIRGDCREVGVRERAIEANGGRGFDAIICDPPYGLRERKDGGSEPIVDLLKCVGDKERRLLKEDTGRIVVFVGVAGSWEAGFDGLGVLKSVGVTEQMLSAAGVAVEAAIPQRLNERLTRVIVVLAACNTRLEGSD